MINYYSVNKGTVQLGTLEWPVGRRLLAQREKEVTVGNDLGVPGPAGRPEAAEVDILVLDSSVEHSLEPGSPLVA